MVVKRLIQRGRTRSTRCRVNLGEKQGKKGRFAANFAKNDVTLSSWVLEAEERYLELCVSSKRYSFKPPNHPLLSAISHTGKNWLSVLVVLDSLVLTQLSPLKFSAAARYAGMTGWWTWSAVVDWAGAWSDVRDATSCLRFSTRQEPIRSLRKRTSKTRLHDHFDLSPSIFPVPVLMSL
jgi:hypothetical protein